MSDSLFQNIKTPYLTIAEQAAEDVGNPDADHQRLFIDSTDQTPKLKNAAGDVSELGGAGGMVLLGTANPTGTNVVTFSSIPADYSKLVIELTARSVVSGTTDSISLSFNNDATVANYRHSYILRYQNTLTHGGGDTNFIGNIAGGTAPANSAGSAIIHIPDYAETSFNKQALSDFTARVDTSSQHIQQIHSSLEWESNVAINRIDLTMGSNFAAGSIVRLYGVI